MKEQIDSKNNHVCKNCGKKILDKEQLCLVCRLEEETVDENLIQVEPIIKKKIQWR